jgi:hypothetical protein
MKHVTYLSNNHRYHSHSYLFSYVHEQDSAHEWKKETCNTKLNSGGTALVIQLGKVHCFRPVQNTELWNLATQLVVDNSGIHIQDLFQE